MTDIRTIPDRSALGDCNYNPKHPAHHYCYCTTGSINTDNLRIYIAAKVDYQVVGQFTTYSAAGATVGKLGPETAAYEGEHGSIQALMTAFNLFDRVRLNRTALTLCNPEIADKAACGTVIGFEPIATLINVRFDTGELLTFPTQYFEKVEP